MLGIVSVTVGAWLATQGGATAQTTAWRSSRAAADESNPFVLLPDHAVFQPLLADQRWPHFGAEMRFYDKNDMFDHLDTIDIGGGLPLVRYSARDKQQWEFGIQGSVVSIFDPDMAHTAMLNNDYIVSLPLSYRFQQFSAMFRMSHQSTHLGDEYILEKGTNDVVKISYEFVDLMASYDVSPHLRTYAAAGYRTSGKPKDFDPWSARAGFEARTPSTYLKNMVQPVFAFDALSQQEFHWNVNLVARGGVEIQSTDMSGHPVQFLVEYFDGHTMDGQFYDNKAKYFGILLRTDFH